MKELWRNKTQSPHLAQKILKSLKTSKRLRSFPNAKVDEPTDSQEWCNEALATHAIEPLTGILSCTDEKAQHQQNDHVCAIPQRLNDNSWWSQSVVRGAPRIRRTTESYLSTLGVLLKSANHIMIMDPHLDPAHRDYRELDQLLLAAKREDGIHPKIEIHRNCQLGLRDATMPSQAEWEARFRGSIGPALEANGMQAEIFIWRGEHDRHIITNLGGIQMGNGLKTNEDPSDLTTWTRLHSAASDAIQKQFDPAVTQPKYRFSVVV